MLCRLFPEKPSQNAPDLAPAGIAVLLSYLLLLLSPSLLLLLLQPIAPSLTGALALLGTAAVLLPIVGYCRLSGQSVKRTLYLEAPRARSVGFFFLGVGLMLLLAALLLIFGAYRLVGFDFSALPYAALLLAVYLVQGSAEELLCRGLLMRMLSERFGGTPSALVSAAFFSLMHIFNPSVSFLGLLNIFLFGLVFASITQKSQSLLGACLLHAGWNFCVQLLGVQVSGNEAEHSLVRLSSDMPFLSGGAFGPEASPLLTLLLFIVILFLSKGKKMA